MYVPGFGSCSSVLHLFAKYPMLILGVGLLAVSSYLISPVGPGHYAGSESILKASEQKTLNATTEPQNVQLVLDAFKKVENTPLSDASIHYVLNHICECNDVRIEDVRNNKSMTREVGLLYFLDLNHEHGLEQAQATYIEQ